MELKFKLPFYVGVYRIQKIFVNFVCECIVVVINVIYVLVAAVLFSINPYKLVYMFMCSIYQKLLGTIVASYCVLTLLLFVCLCVCLLRSLTRPQAR